MKKLTRLIIIIAGLSCLTVTAATNMPSMIINGSGNTATFNLENVRNITFDESNMNINTGESSESFDVLTISGISFDLTNIPNYVELIQTGGKEEISISINNGILTASGPESGNVSLTVYSINGVKVHDICASGQVSINLSDLSKGLYIIKANNKSFSYFN